jgi:hypothetical protein
MPTYPVLFILCGAAAGFFSCKRRWLRAAPAAMLVLFAAASVSIWPHYLAYFNLLVGGPKHGYKHLVDSSLDWGQDLPGLKRWLDEHAPRGPNRPNVYFAYFGRGDVAFEGIKARPLRRTLSSNGTGSFRLSGGIYCVSATELQQVYLTRQRPEPTPVAWTAEQEKQYQRLLPAATRLMTTPNTREARRALLDELCSEWEQAYRDSNQNPQKMKSRLARYRKSLRGFPKLQFARLCAYLRSREPDDSVGYSILIYKLTDEQVQQALQGPVGNRDAD